MDQENQISAGLLADAQASVLRFAETAQVYISNNPYDVIQIGVAALILILFLGFASVRSSRQQREVIKRQAAEILRLSKQLRSARVGQASSDLQPLHEERPDFESETPVESAKEEAEVEKKQELPVALVPQEEAQVPGPQSAREQDEEQGETQISRGLAKSRTGFLARLSGFFSSKTRLDASALEDLEEVLVLSDVGARCASDLVATARKRAEEQGALAPAELTALLKEGILEVIQATPVDHRLYRPTESPLVILVVGVNGVGKTTTVAKLATKYMQQGKKVLAIAADTFRAAAVEQLAEWSSRVGFTLVRGPEGSKPSAVVFDGMVAAKQGEFDVVLIDTAGRLHTKSNLMQELEGVRNVIKKHVPEGPHETVLVVDGVSGQNALAQAREFNSAVSLTGLVVTKLDGTPKGGIIVAISQELHVPVFYIGVGEKVGDLIAFDRRSFVDALFEEKREGVSSASLLEDGKVVNT